MLIDMNNLAHRVFHTPQAMLSTKAGEPSGVILGVLNSIKGVIEKFPDTTKVIACWDGGRSEWRKEIYPLYKAQRDYGKTDVEKADNYEKLWKQMATLHEVLPMFNIRSVKVDKQEADDLIASACKILPGTKLIVTSDKDMLQLISSEVSVYSPLKDKVGKVIGMLDFYDETGVTQESYIGYRALVGDTSDNISGVPGIGDVTAKNLMSKYGHIDNLLNAQGEDKKALMKSKRTAKIFDEANLKVLGRNNKIMNFKYAQYDLLDPAIMSAYEEQLYVNSKNVKDFFIKWQFVQCLQNYMSWIVTFNSLGEE